MVRSGLRTVADWDEDALTMAVEAARGLVSAAPQVLRFASTSAYFTDRSQAAIMVDALALTPATRTVDHANSRRAGTSALLDALLGGRTELVAAAEKRDAQIGSAAHFGQGDGAAAVLTGSDAAARLLGQACLTRDLVDRYTSREHPRPMSMKSGLFATLQWPNCWSRQFARPASRLTSSPPVLLMSPVPNRSATAGKPWRRR